MNSSCWTTRPSAEVDDRLGVQDEPVLVEGVADSPDPAQLLELPLDAETLCGLLADVGEHDDCSVDLVGVKG